MQEKMIPVIGVPPAAPNSAQNTLKPPKNAKNAARIKNPPTVPKKKNVQPDIEGIRSRRMDKALKNMQELAKTPLMKKINMEELVQSTGLPAAENGTFVRAEEMKLTDVEKMALQYWVDVNVLIDPKTTQKQMKKHGFKMKLVWLLNKTIMMNATNIDELKKTQEKSKKLLKSREKKNKEVVPIVLTQSKKKMEKVEKQSIGKLMDVIVEKPRGGGGGGLADQLREFYEKNSGRQNGGGGGGGYQYLNEDWYNSDKPWRKLQTGTGPSSSTDYYASYNNPTSSTDPTMMTPWTSTASMDTYGSFPMTSSYGGFLGASGIDTSAPPPPVISNLSNLGGTSLTDSLDRMLASLKQSMTPDTQPTMQQDALAPGVSPGYVSQYRQQFPIDSQFQSIPQPQTIQPVTVTQQALEVSEEELARQRRLMEIEQELQMINARKVQMQMEEEIRQREFELALQTQRMQERERRVRDREEYSSSTSSRRRGYDDRGSRRSPNTSSSSYSDRHHPYSNSSSSSSNPVRGHHHRHDEISIDEHEGRSRGESGRRYGGQLLLFQQNKMRGDTLSRDGGQECSSLKRQADYGYDEYDDDGRDSQGMIRPAKAPRRRNRKNRAGENAELHMQAISDDED